MTEAVLYAPAAYWTLDPAGKKALVNGCGPRGWLVDLVPDTIYGLSIKPVCDIHDYMFAVGDSVEDMNLANRVFRNNLRRWIDANTTSGWLRKLRYRRAVKYVKAVEMWGGPAFWAGKNKPEELGFVSL